MRSTSSYRRYLKQKSKTQTKRSKSSGQSINLLENDRWLVVVPLDKDASCFHGKGSDWCTTKPNQAYFEDYYYYYHYDKGITLIYCLEKATGGMWAIAATTKIDKLEMFNKRDDPISEDVFQEETGLAPRDLVTLAHTPDNLKRIEDSKKVYQHSLGEVNNMLSRFVIKRDPQLEHHLLIIKRPQLSMKYISELFSANGLEPIEVPDAIVINAAKDDVSVLRMVTGVSNASMLTIVRNDVRALMYITNPSEQLQLEVVEKNTSDYHRISSPQQESIMAIHC